MRLTVKSMAEMLALPALSQMRVLADQKYPKKEPQVFRTPYYTPAISGIRAFYKSGNKPGELSAAISKVQSLGLASKRQNNARVLEAFRNSSMAGRNFSVLPNIKLLHQVGTLELRLTPDLHVSETSEERFVIFNCRAAKLDKEIALRTIEIAHWVAEQSGVKIPVADIEYADLFTGKVHTASKRRAATIKAVVANVQPLTVLWDSL